jgi:hypothetical protein
MESATFNIFNTTEIVHLIHEHFTNSCPVNVTGLSTWLGFGLVCKLFRSLQVQMSTNESQNNDNGDNTNQPVVRSVHQRANKIVQAVQLFLQYKKYPVSIHTQGCNPIVVDSTRRLKSNLKIEWIVTGSDSTLSHYLPYAPHYSTFFDFVRQKSLEAKKLKQKHFCLFHLRRGYFGFIIQCKVENVSKKSNFKQSLRLVKVYQTQSVRYYGQVQQEANKHPSVYGAALHYLLKDCVQYNTFYIALSTKRKREANDNDETEMERAPKKARNDDHQFYSWNDSNFERRPTTFVIEDESKEAQESEETQQESDNPPRCLCTFL